MTKNWSAFFFRGWRNFHFQRCPGQPSITVKLNGVRDKNESKRSAESSWAMSKTARNQAECKSGQRRAKRSCLQEECIHYICYARSKFNILYTLKILRMQCDSTIHYIHNIIICHYIGKLVLIMSCGKKMQYHLYENSLWKSVSAGQKEKSRWVVTLKVLWDKVF